MGNEGWHVASARNLASGVGPLRWQPCAQGRGELALLWRLLPLVGAVACGRLLVRTGRVSGALWRGGGQEGQPGLQTSWGLPSERVCHLAHVFTLSNCFSLLGRRGSAWPCLLSGCFHRPVCVELAWEHWLGWRPLTKGPGLACAAGRPQSRAALSCY